MGANIQTTIHLRNNLSFQTHLHKCAYSSAGPLFRKINRFSSKIYWVMQMFNLHICISSWVSRFPQALSTWTLLTNWAGYLSLVGAVLGFVGRSAALSGLYPPDARCFSPRPCPAPSTTVKTQSVFRGCQISPNLGDCLFWKPVFYPQRITKQPGNMIL